MHRVFGAVAVFAAWMCLPLSAIFGIAATQSLGLTIGDAPLPAYGVYGLPEVLMVALLGSTAVLAIAPFGSIILSARPGRWVYPTAAVWGAIGVVLLFDDLGRAHAAALIPGAFLLWGGTKLIERANEEDAAANAPAEARVSPTAPADARVAPTTPAAVVASAAPALVPRGASATAPDGPTALDAAPPAETPGGGKRSRRRSAPAGKTSSSKATTGGSVCPWCSASIEAGAENCPGCGAALVEKRGPETNEIAGVTAVAPELLKYLEVSRARAKRPGLISMIVGDEDDRLLPPGDGPADAFAPPSPEVLAAMAALDREIAGARRPDEQVLPPDEPQADEARPEPPDGPALRAPEG